MSGFGETCPNKARSGFRRPPPRVGGPHPYRFHRGGRGLDLGRWYQGLSGRNREGDAPGRRPRSSLDQRSGRGAAAGRGGPADLPAADALDPTPPGDCSGARGSPGRGGGTSPSARPLRRPRAPPRQLTPRIPSHSPSSPRQQQGRGGGSRQAPSLLSVLLTEAGYSDQTRRRHGARAYEGTGERARASGPNTAAHVTRCPPLLRNRWPGYAPPSRISGLRAGVRGLSSPPSGDWGTGFPSPASSGLMREGVGPPHLRGRRRRRLD